MLKRISVIAVAVVLAAVLCSAAGAKIQLPHVISDNMVLQSGASTPIWGWTTPGQKVTVTFAGQTVSAIAGKDGKWMTALKGLKQSDQPASMTVASGADTITINNILVGDVWVGSGQSNMEFGTEGVLNAQSVLQDANRPTIRLYLVPHNLKGQEQPDVNGRWAVCSPDSVRGFSAVLYLFGREISDKTKTPLGLIETNWGGTNIETWIPYSGYVSEPSLAELKASIDKTNKDYQATLPEKIRAVQNWVDATNKALKNGTQIPVTPEWPEWPIPDRWATALYNGMVNPIIPFGIRGAIWYQGEANGGENESYRLKMQTLVSSWRKLWGRGDFPFYVTQLANWLAPNTNPGAGDGWAPTREAQLKFLAYPNIGMAVTTDIGEEGDIHPKNKQDVGKRLSLWALRDVYGMKNLVVSGPLYKSVKIEGNKAIVSFDYVGKGLMVGEKTGLEPTKEVPGGKLKQFAIAGADKVWHWEDATIVGNTVVVSSPDVAAPVAVRYAYTMNPAGANLYNKEGLPASAFRTDDW